MKQVQTTKKVDVLNLSNEADRAIYEALLNDPSVTIIKEVFAYDKSNRAMITIWYEIEV